MEKTKILVICSGYFNPLHKGHIEYLKRSKEAGTFLYVIVNNDLQREIIRSNFINSGFQVLRIINEPSAAALSYGLSTTCNDDEKILVLDLGCGTLDITVLLKDNGFFEGF